MLTERISTPHTTDDPPDLANPRPSPRASNTGAVTTNPEQPYPQTTERIPNINLLGGVDQPAQAHLDWASVSIPTHASRPLLDVTQPDDENAYLVGFRTAESRRVVVGGAIAKRGTEPIYPSALWGTDYEHWSFSGDAMVSPVLDALASLREVRCSRLDVAFDLYGIPPLEVRDLQTHARAHSSSHGSKPHTRITESTNGDGEVGSTLYLGAPSSRRIVRIYNKAAEQAAKGNLRKLNAELATSWWRVEFQYRGDYADHLFRLFAGIIDDDHDPHDLQCPYLHAMGELSDLYGLYIGKGKAVKITPRPQLKIADTLYALTRQYTEALIIAEDAGIDLAGLAKMRFDQSTPRKNDYRFKERKRDLEAFGVDQVMQYIMDRIMAEVPYRHNAYTA